MIKIKANIEINHLRKVPFISKYRPLFLFQDGVYTSGSIELKDREYFYPGDCGIVEINFLEIRFLGIDFNIGSQFIICESPRSIIGSGIVLDILETY